MKFTPKYFIFPLKIRILKNMTIVIPNEITDNS